MCVGHSATNMEQVTRGTNLSHLSLSHLSVSHLSAQVPRSSLKDEIVLFWQLSVISTIILVMIVQQIDKGRIGVVRKMSIISFRAFLLRTKILLQLVFVAPNESQIKR